MIGLRASYLPLSAWSRTQMPTAYFFLHSFINKIAEQIFGMVPYICSCVPECPICVVSESQDTRIFDIKRKELLKPGNVRVWASPSFCRISSKTMNRNDTGWLYKLDEIMQKILPMRNLRTYSRCNSTCWSDSNVG